MCNGRVLVITAVVRSFLILMGVVFGIAVFLFWWLSGGGVWLIDAYLSS